MPELPEVETVVRTLEKRIDNRIINKVEVRWPKIIDNVSKQVFEESLVNQQFLSFDRRGKFLIFGLTDYVLVAHLRMEGKFYVYPEHAEPDKHSHVIFYLDKGELHFNDVRKFGRMYLYKKGEHLTALDKLGYEPWDERLTAEYLKNYCKGKSLAIKSQLLDQSMIAGIGNIYANEICFEVRINPEHQACYISLNKWDEIIASTKKILEEAIKAGGTTIRSYTSSLGVTGLFQQELYVQSREKEECLVCHDIIRKKFVNGRGTYYCPSCQKEKALFVAVTGNIGSGKSTVSSMMKEHGYPVISCDEVNAELLKKNSTKESLAEIFKCDIKKINKTFIRKMIYSDENIKREVEECLHSLIWKEVKEFYKNHESESAVIAEVPLLFETDWYRRFDCNILVTADKEAVFKRLADSRGMSRQEAEIIMANQMSDDKKIQLSDMVIKNNSSVSKLSQSVEKAINDIVKFNLKEQL